MSDWAIEEVQAWEALDSRGRPTVGCALRLRGGASGEAMVPAGASTGRHEARELRDGGPRYAGQGVRAAVANVTGALAEAVRGLDVTDQAAVDRRLREADGTADLGRLGSNAVLAVSVAAAVTAAAARGLPLHQAAGDGTPGLLPRPMVNIISGGAHAGRVLDIQDVLAIPIAAQTFGEAIEWISRVRHHTALAAQAQGLDVHLVADEGGLGLPLADNRSAVALVAEGIERAGFAAGDEVAIALDVAASEFVDGDGYALRAEGRRLSAEQLVTELLEWCTAFPVVSIEDALGEDDWAGWQDITRRAPNLQLIGDDLFVTNQTRLQRGIDSGAANAILVKPNQIGTLSQAREVVRTAQAAGYHTVLSARSGETEDAWLADLAVAWRTGQLKVGSTMRSERTAKWNRLLRIEAQCAAAGTEMPLAPWSRL